MGYIIIDQNERETKDGIVQVHYSKSEPRIEKRTQETDGKTVYDDQIRKQIEVIQCNHGDGFVRKHLLNKGYLLPEKGGNSKEFIDLKLSNKSIIQLIEDIENIDNKNGSIISKLELRQYQQDLIKKAINCNEKTFGIFMLPRKGKTVCCLLIGKKLWEISYESTLVICLSSRIEVKEAFQNDISNFKELNSVYTTFDDYTDIKVTDNISFSSLTLQMLQKHTFETRDIFKQFKNVYVMIDESDEGGNTENVKYSLKLLDDYITKIFYITGTPGKLYETGLFIPQSDNQYVLDEFDERSMNFERTKHPEVKRLTISIQDYVNNKERYLKDFTFSFSAFFENVNGEFTYEDDVRNFMNWLFSSKQTTREGGTQFSGPLNNLLINETDKAHNCMILVDTINQCKALEKTLSTIPGLYPYQVNGEVGNSNANQINNLSISCRNSDKRLVIITCGMKCRAATFKDIDITIAMRGGFTYSLYEQFARRGCNPNIKTTKTHSWYIDLCPERVYISTISKLVDHQFSHNLQNKESIESLLKKYDVCSNLYQYSNGKFDITNVDDILSYYRQNYNFSDNIFINTFSSFDFNRQLNFGNIITKKNTTKFGENKNVGRPKNTNSIGNSGREKYDKKKNDSFETLRKALPFFMFIFDIKTTKSFLEMFNSKIYDTFFKNYFDTEDSFIGLFDDIDIKVFQKELDSLWMDWFPKDWKDDRNRMWSFINNEVNPFIDLSKFTIEITDEYTVIVRNIWSIPENSEKVWFVTNLIEEKLLVTKYCPKVNIFYTEDFDLEEIYSKVKFTKGLMNPPYGKLHLKILAKMTEEIVDKNNGEIISIQPVRWLQDPLYDKKRGSDALKYKKSFENKIDDLIILNEKEAKKAFNNDGLTMDLAIFNLKQNGKFNYDSLHSNSLLEKFKNHINRVNTTNQTKWFVSFSSIINRNRGRGSKGYFSRGVFTEESFIIFWNSKKNNKGSGDTQKIYFKSKKEAENFHHYCELSSVRAVFMMFSLDVNVQAKLLPFVDDYSKQWTNEQFYEYFNISSEEKIIIENKIKEIDS